MTRYVFMDLIVLADSDGVVDMTPDFISSITRVPVEIVERAIAELEKPDPNSRNPSEGGARLARLDAHRNWGWLIVNYADYRQLASEEQRRFKTRERVRKFRGKEVTQCNAVGVTERDQALPLLHGVTSPSPSSCTCTSTGTSTEKTSTGNDCTSGTEELPFKEKEFAVAWAEWVQHRKEKGQKLTSMSIRMQFKKLKEIGLKRAIAALEHSIAGGWTGIFEETGKKHDEQARKKRPAVPEHLKPKIIKP